MTFIEKLNDSFMSHKHSNDMSKIIEEMIETFITYGQYLNAIPDDYRFFIIQELFFEVYSYKRNLKIFCDPEFKKRPKKNKTISPGVLISRDINTLKKARSLISDQVIEKYLLWSELELPLNCNREEFNKIYSEKISIYSEQMDITMMAILQKAKNEFDAYFTLTDMIKDLESKSFEILNELNYFIPKPNKNGIRKILTTIRKQFKLKVSHDEKQLLDNL